MGARDSLAQVQYMYASSKFFLLFVFLRRKGELGNYLLVFSSFESIRMLETVFDEQDMDSIINHADIEYRICKPGDDA